jgi:hypothetical protein
MGHGLDISEDLGKEIQRLNVADTTARADTTVRAVTNGKRRMDDDEIARVLSIEDEPLDNEIENILRTKIKNESLARPSKRLAQRESHSPQVDAQLPKFTNSPYR